MLAPTSVGIKRYHRRKGFGEEGCILDHATDVRAPKDVMYRLDIGQEKILLEEPESGMGYQLLRAAINGEGSLIFFAFNTELLVEPNELHELAGEGFEDEVETADAPQEFEVEEVFDPASQENYESFDIQPPDPSYPSPKLPLSRSTGAYDGFKRYLAGPRDPRVNEDGSLRPGTYVTTVSDSALVPSGLAAVGRYALPNPRPARYVSTIVPEQSVSVRYRYGTVVPAFGQSGGGVEVFFVDPVPPGSVLPPYLISEA